MYFEDIKVGTVVDIAPVVIEKEKMMEFARVYDYIPLHTDEAYAKTTMFGDLIAPGVMTFMSVWAKYLEIDLCGAELVAGKSTKIEWLKPVYAGDELTAKAVVRDKFRRNRRNGIILLSIEAYNQKGELVLKDLTESVVKCREEV